MEQIEENESGIVAESDVDLLVQSRFDVGEELVLTMILDRHQLGDVFAIVGEAGLYLELSPYITLVEFPIKKSATSNVFKGWFINEENTFALDISNPAQPFVTIAEKKYYFSRDLLQEVNGYLYVHESLIYEWFGIQHEYKFSALRMRLFPSEPLPLQQRLVRAGRKAATFGENKAQHPELKRSYGIFSPQTFDIQLGTSYREASDALSSRYSILGARDIALLHANFFLTGTDDDYITDSRIIFSRESLDQNLLNIGAARIEFGDIQPIRQGLTRDRSRGLLISNAPIGNTFDKEQINLIGPMQQGWDVELYRDGVLLNKETNVQSGEYSFLDVELNFGLNEFEIVKYGPQGQIEKEMREQYLNESTVYRKGVNYSVSLTESDKSVFGTANVATKVDAGYNFASDFSFNALGNNWGFGFQSDFGGDITRNIFSANTSRVISGSYLASGFMTASDDNTLNLGLGLTGRIGSQNLRFSASRNAYIDDNLGEQASNNLSFQVNGEISESSIGRLNQSTRINYIDSPSARRMSIQNLLGLSTNIGRFNNKLEYISSESLMDEAEWLRGSFNYSKAFGKLFGQLSLGYEALEDPAIKSLNSSFAYSISNNISARITAGYRFDNESYLTNLLLNYRTGHFNLSSNFSYSSANSWSAGLNASFGFSAQPLLYGETFITNRNAAKAATLSVRVFVDQNANYQYDLGEQLLEDVEVISKQSFARGSTDKDGVAILTGITHQSKSDIEVNVDTLPDPFLKPVVDGVSIRFRAGIADSLDFPIVLTTEVEGTAFLTLKNGESIAATKVPIMLVDEHGNIIAERYSEFDGYYVLGKVPTGSFTLKVDEGFLDKNDLKYFEPIPITVDAESGDFVFQDIYLERKDEISGYIAILGKFASQAQLNLFVRLHRNSLKPIKQVLAIKTDNESKQLVSHFFIDEEKVKELCDRLIASKLACRVEKYVHRYDM